MKMTKVFASLLFPLAFGCDEPKSDAPAAPAQSSAVAASSIATPPVPIPPPAPPAPTFAKKLASDCKAHPATIDFGDETALEHEVRRKLS